VTEMPDTLDRVLSYCDVGIVPVCQGNERAIGFTYVCRNLFYDMKCRHDEHHICAMAKMFTHFTGLALTVNVAQLAYYNGAREDILMDLPETYCVIAASGKYHTQEVRRLKEYGSENMAQLATLVERDTDIKVVQAPGPSALIRTRLTPSTNLLADTTIPQLYAVVKNAAFVIALENGLSHVAGHTRTPCFTLYMPDTPSRPKHCSYPTQTAIELKRRDTSGFAVFEAIRATAAYKTIREKLGRG